MPSKNVIHKLPQHSDPHPQSWQESCFSSVLFISVDDAVVVVAGLMASVMMCRVILTYELAKLRRVVERIKRHRGLRVLIVSRERPAWRIQRRSLTSKRSRCRISMSANAN